MPAIESAPPGRHLLAPHHLRLFAFLLDYLSVIAGLKLAEQVLLGEGWDLRLAQHAPEVFPLWWLAAVAALFLGKDAAGASLGKWVMGLSVRRIERPEESPPLKRLLGRNLSLLLLPADLVLIFRDPQFRRLGDRWFGTVVVVRNPLPAITQRAFGLGILFLGFMLSALLITSWNLRRTAAYQVAQHAVLGQPSVEEQLGRPVEWDRSPNLDLRLDQGTALLTFKAKGKARESDVRVRLVLRHGPPPAWTVAGIDLPAPAPGPAPLVRDAPASK